MSQTPVFGASFSLHRCSELGLDKKALLNAAITELGFKRFRLMSYWNIHEQQRGEYDFTELDWQFDLIAQHGGQVSLAIGVRQPRWPEWHMPSWAAELPDDEWYTALYHYLEIVVLRYKDHPALVSWQLENEALLKTFGIATDYNRNRLRYERNLIKKLDPAHPLIMTLSDSWGIPIRGPRPDSYAMSLYRATINKHGELNHSLRPALFYRLRRVLIRGCTFRDTFIHEMQAEPWLSGTVLNTNIEIQLERMSPVIFRENLDFSRHTGVKSIDLWGLEWWYWLKVQQDRPEMWEAVRSSLTKLR